MIRKHWKVFVDGRMVEVISGKNRLNAAASARVKWENSRKSGRVIIPRQIHIEELV